MFISCKLSQSEKTESSIVKVHSDLAILTVFNFLQFLNASVRIISKDEGSSINSSCSQPIKALSSMYFKLSENFIFLRLLQWANAQERIPTILSSILYSIISLSICSKAFITF
jgi:hypothetical protein